jgi:hypothetical protein
MHYTTKNRHERKATRDADKNPEGRWRKYPYEDLLARDEKSLDLFWLKGKGLTDLDNLPVGIVANYWIWDSSRSATIAFMPFMRYCNRSKVLEIC